MGDIHHVAGYPIPDKSEGRYKLELFRISLIEGADPLLYRPKTDFAN